MDRPGAVNKKLQKKIIVTKFFILIKKIYIFGVFHNSRTNL